MSMRIDEELERLGWTVQDLEGRREGDPRHLPRSGEANAGGNYLALRLGLVELYISGGTPLPERPSWQGHPLGAL